MKRFIAAITFFTRIPLWKFITLPTDAFARIVPFWSITGWITAGIFVLTFFLGNLFLPKEVALLLAMCSRLILTGGLHEDGLADFLDGFGGGTTKEKILSIMKDSHIGSYGVIGLIFYFALFFGLLHSLPIELAGLAVLAGDPFGKTMAAMTINRLPYARKAEDAKSKTVYSRMTATEWFIALLGGVVALCWLPEYIYTFAIALPLVVWFLLTTYMNRKINGYTGDCCGALFLLCELSFYLSIVIIYHYGIIPH